MRFERSSWRKLYVTESIEHRMLPLFARGLRDYLLRLAEEDGTLIRATSDPARDLAVVLAVAPGERKQLKHAVDALLRIGYLTYEGGWLRIAKFVEAQTARTPGAKRQQRYRNKVRSDGAEGDVETSPETTDDASPVTSPSDARDTSQRDETRRDETRRQVQRPSPGDDPDSPLVTCPRDLDLLEAQKSNLEFAGAKRWQVDTMVVEIRTKLLGSSDLKTVEGWRKYLTGAVTRRWSNPSERPQKPPADPAPPVTDAERKQTAEAYERHIKRQRERNRRLLEESNG